METLTVKQLREIAKQRGLKGYYKLRKGQLIDILDTDLPLRKTRESHVLDSPVPDIKVPVLQPTAYVPQKTQEPHLLDSPVPNIQVSACLLYTSDAADE